MGTQAQIQTQIKPSPVKGLGIEGKQRRYRKKSLLMGILLCCTVIFCANLVAWAGGTLEGVEMGQKKAPTLR